MKWRVIIWKPAATYQDRIDAMNFIMGMDDAPMPSEFFINDIWVDERPTPIPE